MISATFDGQKVQIYKNLKCLITSDVDLADAAPIARLAPRGPWPNAHPFVGKIADFAIWNRELGVEDLEGLMKTLPAR
jgi:hypothetical protein